MYGVINFYSSDKEYKYYTDIEDLESGDLVMVETSRGLTNAEFVRYIETANAKSKILFKFDKKQTNIILDHYNK